MRRRFDIASFVILFCISQAFGQSCTNMWDADEATPASKICPVQTDSGQQCKFPFFYNGKEYKNCIVLNTIQNYPKCITTAEIWSNCIVPNDAVIYYTTTTNGGNWYNNGASMNGGTMLYIIGNRFSENLFSTSPTSETSNQVFLVNDYLSYGCEIHPDKVTSTQITCYTPAMAAGTYFVRVFVKGKLIPNYQYVYPDQANIKVSDANTPKIKSLNPQIALPQSLLAINGDIKAFCFARDDMTNDAGINCADDLEPRILRIFVGGSGCEMLNPEANELYVNNTYNQLTCKLQKAEVNYFNASILISNEYGRSLPARNTYYVSPDDKLHHFQTYAEIQNVSPQVGSTVGGNITISGLYFYDDINVPAKIEIGGQPCVLAEFNMQNLPNTTFICQNSPQLQAQADYYGNRGINLIRDNIYVPLSGLAAAVPSANAQESITYKTEYIDFLTNDVTVWLKGYFNPRINSTYEFSLITNGEAQLYISTDTTSTNKVLISSATNQASKGSVSLDANKNYFMLVIASKRAGKLNFTLNAKMLKTNLIDTVSDNVINEIQEIEISSTIVPESFNIEYNYTATTGQSEIQEIVIQSLGVDSPFVLQFDGVTTSLISFGATARELQNALNDLPNLSPDLVTVTQSLSTATSTTYSVIFNADLGDVPLLDEVSKNVDAVITEKTQGVPTGNRIQLKVIDSTTGIFNPKDTSANIKSVVNQVFGIRCPASILNSSDTIYTNDNEVCIWGTNPLTETAFCGKCSKKNTNSLFYNLNTTLDNKFICFAYKLTKKAFNAIYFQIIDPITNSPVTLTANVYSIADSNWHYNCTDLSVAFSASSYAKYPLASIRLFQAWFNPSQNDMYTDALTIRKTLPLGYNDQSLLTTRRLYPSIQMFWNTLAIVSTSSLIQMTYRPGNCLYNLEDIQVKQNITGINVTRTKSATEPVNGTFNLVWNDVSLNVSADMSENGFRSLLESIENFGLIQATRTKDCAGYKWRFKWLTGGDKANFTIPSNTLTGNNPSIKATMIQDGGAFFNPIRDDLLRTYHTKPQVTISVNDINSRCSGSCDFEWSSSATPTVTAIDKTTLSAIKITGTGFDATTLSNNIVLIGSVPCSITSATTTELICAAGENPVGTYYFTISVLNKGLAQMSVNPTASFSLTASSLSPISSGTGGGVTLSITGLGFNQNSQVTVGNNECKIVSISYSLIKCIVPSNPTLSNLTVDVTVTMNSTTSNSLQFLYDADHTPVVTDINPRVLSVLGNQLVTVTGTNLPISPINVYFGKQRVRVVNSTSTVLVLRSEALAPGLYDLVIPVENIGNIKVNIKLEHVFYVSSITPKSGSIRGGTLSTIYGDGFSSNCSLNKVTFENQPCKVVNCSSNWIQCKTSDAYLVHQIDNSAADPYAGKGYAWSKPYLKINIGDTVKWTWEPPTGIRGISYKVAQVADTESVDTIGFSSGESTPTGSYSFQFNEAGTFYYWSGYVESTGQISFRGVIVVEDSFDKELTVNVELNGFSAQKCTFPFTYNSITYNACTNVDFSYDWCSPTSTYSGQILKCNSISDPTPAECAGNGIDMSGVSLSEPTSNYDMLFTKANDTLPLITYVSLDNITMNSDIVIRGTGFSSTQCENQVYISDVLCSLLNSSTTELTCKLASNSNLYPNIAHRIEVLVKNIGYALQNGSFLIHFQPVITNISPLNGSVAGGTQLTIDGSGFIPKSTVIQIGHNYYYYNDGKETVITYDKITLKTVTNMNEEADYEILVTSNTIQAVCSLDRCNFTYTLEKTPEVSDITPKTINSPTNITITGANFSSNVQDFNIKIGNQNCSVNYADESSVVCELRGLNYGEQDISLNINGVGDALNTQLVKLTGSLLIQSISPSNGSINGGTVLTIVGNGFDETTQVLVHTAKCNILSKSIEMLTCETTAHTSGSVSYSIQSRGTSYVTSGFSFVYDQTISPVVSSISPTHGSSGVLTITGSGFDTDPTKVKVKIGNTNCLVQTVPDNSQITCNLDSSSAGVFSVVVLVDNIGYSNNNIKFTYDLSASSLSQTQGSLGGNLDLVISGQGFSSKTNVTICGKPCPVTSSSLTKLTCTVPEATDKTRDTNCQVVVAEAGQTDSSLQYSYLATLTPSLISVSPLRGGTGGGTLLTITGTNFYASQIDQVTVKIAGSLCDVSYLSTTQIQCRTNSYAYSSIAASVEVFIKDSGRALNNGSVLFEYIDLWSSRWTWGGMDPPGEGEIAVIGKNQYIYLDTTTPVLKGILIIGGSLIFDDNQDVELNAEYIVIAEGGKLQVGTREKPFMHNAIITMHGTVRSLELPIFGSKVIGIRNGTIDLHGAPVGVTWTHLSMTASSGQNTIKLKEPVNWNIGSTIVIATTGDKYTPGQSEERIITAKSADKTVLTLDKPLLFTHLYQERTVGTGSRTRKIIVRAEVGLLTRNVLVRGSIDNSWTPLLSAPPCPNGFDPDEFATQTCFLGRYGPEIGTDQIGATIMLSGPMRKPNEPEAVIGRFSNVELFHVGQAFRLGRYPIHFHMNGDMPSSYVIECAIHESFNRATNIHASNYITIERNVIYNIMGGAYFLEDGIEIGNKFRYNLAIYVKTSSSLLNEDQTPAAFWVTNPNNTYEHNAIAGCTHFGWWYRILEHSEGPSYDPNYCPRLIPFGTFFNNSAHSTGRFGLWVFPRMYPTVSGRCNDKNPLVAKFFNFESYSCDKGAEYVESNTIQFINFTVWDHYSIGIEAKTLYFNQQPNIYYKTTFYDEKISGLVADSVIIGNSKNDLRLKTTPDGLVIPWDRGQVVKNIEFYNFPSNDSRCLKAPVITCRCSDSCGGWTTLFKGLYFDNVLYRTYHRWDWDTVMRDLDGTLTGRAGDVVIYKNNFTIDNPNCHDDGFYLNGIACSNTKTWIRFAFNNFKPELALLMNITNYANKMTVSPFKRKRLTHTNGFMMTLEGNQSYTLFFDQAERPTNISYIGAFFDFAPNDWLIIKHPLSHKPDQVTFFPSKGPEKQSYYPLSFENNNNGDWYWDNDTLTLNYILMNKNNVKPLIDYDVVFSAIKCRYAGCAPPVSPAYKLPVTKRPADALFWSNKSTWAMAPQGWGGYYGNGQYGLPKDNDSVIIPDGKYVVVDCPLPKMKYLQIEGVLEFDNGRDHYLEVELIFINGGQLIIGWENDPILTDVKIVFVGTKDSLNCKLPDGINLIGGKGMGVYGGLDLHGRPRSVTWTRLRSTAQAGSSSFTLVEPVDWRIGDKIIMTTTSYIANQTEVLNITGISGDKKTITVSNPLVYTHIAFNETLPDGQKYEIAAGVGLLTSNLKIIGGEYPEQEADLYGFRIIVSDYSVIVNGIEMFYKGYARISSTEFFKPGQFSRDSGDDRKYGILISNLNEYNNSRPTYLYNNSFHMGYSCAIGISTSASIPVVNNVVYRTIEFSLRIEGHSNIIRRNLIAMNYWASSFITWEAKIDKKYWGAIEITEAEAVVLEDNFVAGAERIGVHFRGDVCNGESLGPGYNHSLKRNTIYAALTGVVIIPIPATTIKLFTMECLKVSGFTVYKAVHWAIYFQSTARAIIDSNTLIENSVGIFAYVLAPLSLSHVPGFKNITFSNNLIVGQTNSFNCKTDVFPNDLNFLSASTVTAFGAGPNSISKIGVVWGNFLDGSNSAPGKPWPANLNYNQITGLTIVKNTTFANFGLNCNGTYDAVIANNLKNDDGQHPVTFEKIKLFNVDNSSKVWLFRPREELIDMRHCYDMDCDAMKKNLLTDKDGSFLGSPGTVISQSEFEWGSQKRGLGDFRIPKEALAAPNGSYIPPSQVYDRPGIVRDENLCKYIQNWQAYECHGLDHKMLVIESMDSDTEARRLSPVAILSNNRYLDLINGPQDHSRCGGYTCSKRISTFLAIIAANMSFDIYLTSSVPNQLRFRVLNADASFKVKLSLYYISQQRIDLYKNDVFVRPTNAFDVGGKMQIRDAASNLAFMPHCLNDSGTNLFHTPSRKMYFIMDGTGYIDLKIAPVLFVKFGLPAITPQEFFNEATLVTNFARLLGVDSTKIRRVQVIRESSRKRQANALTYVVLTFFNDPVTNSSDTGSQTQQQNEMKALDTKITNLYMTGQLQQQAQQVLNVTLASLAVQQPSSNATAKPIVKIAKTLVLRQPSNCKAQTPCLTQPVVAIVDENNQIVSNGGSIPWVIQAEINSSSNANAKLILETEVVVVNGYANFTKLGISDIADSLVLNFKFKLPDGVNSSSFDPMLINSNSFKSEHPQLTCKDYSSSKAVVNENDNFNLTISIVDKSTGIKIPNITWNNYQWIASIRLYSVGNYPANGTLVVTNASVTFDTSTGFAQFNNLKITKAGMYLISITVATLNNEFNLQCYSNLIQIVKSISLLKTYSTDTEPDYTLKFNGNYNEINPDEIKASVYNYISNYGINIAGINAYAGSVIVTFYSDDTNAGLLNQLIASGLNVSSSLTFVSITSGGQTFTCTNCTIVVINTLSNTTTASNGVTIPTTSKQSNSQLDSKSESKKADQTAAIVGGVFGGVILVVAIVFGVYGYNQLKQIKIRRIVVTPRKFSNLERPPNYEMVNKEPITKRTSFNSTFLNESI